MDPTYQARTRHARAFYLSGRSSPVPAGLGSLVLSTCPRMTTAVIRLLASTSLRLPTEHLVLLLMPPGYRYRYDLQVVSKVLVWNGKVASNAALSSVAS